jgi:cyanophycinase-like exopeptidase
MTRAARESVDRGPVYLVASGQDGLLPRVAARAYEALGKTKARVAVTYSPVAGDARGLRFMSGRMARLFPEATIERFAVAGEDAAMTPAKARAVVDRADLVFVSGGDPSLGAKVLESAGASAWLRDANARGVPLMGVSAGAIALGAWWADWPEEDDAQSDPETELARTKLLACVGAVPAHVFDTHNEEDDWDELRLLAKLCSRHGEKARFIGIPTGGALIFDGNGRMESVGTKPVVLE